MMLGKIEGRRRRGRQRMRWLEGITDSKDIGLDAESLQCGQAFGLQRRPRPAGLLRGQRDLLGHLGGCVLLRQVREVSRASALSGEPTWVASQVDQVS